MTCSICHKDPSARNAWNRECSHVDCPHRPRAWSDGLGGAHAEVDESITKCPWCGASGPNFDESPMPSDYCGHDPALVV